jgi:hypothetical protein
MKLEITTVVMTGAIALAVPLAFAADDFAPYGEDFTRGEPIPPGTLKSIEHAKPLLAPRTSPPPRSTVAVRRAPRRRAEGMAGSPAQAVQVAPLPKSGL